MTTVLSDDTIRHVAQLAKLHLNDQEVHFYKGELQKVLQAFADLNDAQNHQGERSAVTIGDVTAQSSDSVSHLQADEVKHILETQEFLKQTPDHEGSFVRVPAILSSST